MIKRLISNYDCRHYRRRQVDLADGVSAADVVPSAPSQTREVSQSLSTLGTGEGSTTPPSGHEGLGRHRHLNP